MFSNAELDIIKTQIISLGTCCSYAKYKRQFFIEQKKDCMQKDCKRSESECKKKCKRDWGQTHFFDWLLCRYPNNLTILKTNNIKELLQYDNWMIHPRRKTGTLCKNIKF